MNNLVPTVEKLQRLPDIDIFEAWCKCEKWCENPIFADDGICKCGIEKHHWHCRVCNKLQQVG